MPTQINAETCSKALFGTGIVPCVVKFGRITSVLRVAPSWKFDPATETFNLAYVISKVQDGTFAPFLNTLEFLNNTPETTTKEYQDGAKAATRHGKPEFSLEFNNGLMWHRAAYSYNGFRTSSVILIDAAGNVRLLSNVAETQLTGFLTNMFDVPTDTPQVGDEPAKTLIMFQIANEEAYNTRSTIISMSQIGADLNEELKGFLNVTITGTASVANGLTIQVNSWANKVFGIEALTTDNFRVRNSVTNAVIPIDTVTAGATPGSYVIETTPALTLASTVIVETYDATATPPVATALVDTNLLYKGASLPLTAGA